MFHVRRSKRNGARLLQNRETGVAAVSTEIGHVEVIDNGAGRSMADVALEALQRLDIAFGPNFHPAVGRIPDPPVQAFAGSSRMGEEPEPDALDAAPDDIASSEAHRVERRL
jgi:hypothetical protein